MIRIELSKTTQNKIEKLHKLYVEQTSIHKLEQIIIQKDQQYKFFESIFGNTETERKNRIIDFCLSKDLKKILNIFASEFYSYYKFEYQNPRDKKQLQIVKEVRKKLDEIFDYKNFNIGKKNMNENGEEYSWNRHIYVVNTGVKVCPYCNRQYITSYTVNDVEDKTTADVDHYYPKSIYPCLQMNIYNMIPSCTICNSKMKGSSDERHLYPYQDSSESLKFEVLLDDVEKLYTTNVEKININENNNPKSIASNKVFKLDKIYQAHVGDVSKLIYYIKEYEAFKEKYYMSTMGIEIGNIFSMWFEFLGQNPLEEPLVKLKSDIYKQVLGNEEKCNEKI